ncbi:MAG: inositol monophosphatase family protein [Sciscionella sp.]
MSTLGTTAGSTPGHDDLRLALRLADAADEITTRRFLATDLRVEDKPDRTPVTDADVAVEDRVRELLAGHSGEDVVGEERGGTVRDGRCWLVDPIDGTKNFSRGVPVWASLIALLVDGVPRLGVVSAPALHRRWWAASGAGAWTSVDGGEPRPITVSGVGELADAYVSTTDQETWVARGIRERYLRLADQCLVSRAFGDFWQHCLVAEGAIDLAVEAEVSPWDVAALQVLVTEAGGTFTDLSGAPRHDGGSALSSNGRLHDAALGLLRAEG